MNGRCTLLLVSALFLRATAVEAGIPFGDEFDYQALLRLPSRTITSALVAASDREVCSVDSFLGPAPMEEGMGAEAEEVVQEETVAEVAVMAGSAGVRWEEAAETEAQVMVPAVIPELLRDREQMMMINERPVHRRIQMPKRL